MFHALHCVVSMKLSSSGKRLKENSFTEFDTYVHRRGLLRKRARQAGTSRSPSPHRLVSPARRAFCSDTQNTDHCIDYIRQTIQCHGDLTPIPERWWDSAQRSYSDTGLTHTCRDFGALRGWMTKRHNGSTAVAEDPDNGF
jgi:hypothetical protein